MHKDKGKKFRSQLLETYEKNVITNCNIDKVLQAAHIKPYRGKKTNHLQNGILLRSDIHDLFDLFLISINPLNMKVVISDSLLGTYLDKYSNKTINLPHKIENHPSKEFLNWYFNEFEKQTKKHN